LRRVHFFLKFKILLQKSLNLKKIKVRKKIKHYLHSKYLISGNLSLN
jgi:hypothetical protein